jgi:hypothetical protein
MYGDASSERVGLFAEFSLKNASPEKRAKIVPGSTETSSVRTAATSCSDPAPRVAEVTELSKDNSVSVKHSAVSTHDKRLS